MARVKIQLADNIKRVVYVETAATVGADIGVDLRYGGQVQTLAQLQALFGGSGATTVNAHRLLLGLTVGDDHPQYTRRDILTADGDLYTRAAGIVVRKPIGSTDDVLTTVTGAPTWRAPAAVTKTDDTNVTLTLGGTPATAALKAVSFTLGWTGQLAAARGGTGIGTYAVGDLLYASGGSALSKLADVTTGNALISGGVGVAPAWGKIGLGTHVSGRLPLANLVQGAALTVLGVTGNATADYAGINAGTDGFVLRRTGTTLAFGTVDTAGITNDAITYAKMQNVSATNRFLGRITAGAGDAEELTGTQATTLLDLFTSTLKGLVPLSAGGTTNFLRADGTWAAPAAGGTVANPTATIGLTAVNGVATSAIRSDGAPALSQAIAPTWTAGHTFSLAASGLTFPIVVASALPGYRLSNTGGATDSKHWRNYVSGLNLTYDVMNDAATAASTWLNVVRSAAAVASITYGNATDQPQQVMYGNLRVVGNGTQADFSLWKDTSPTVAADFGLNNTSIGGVADGPVIASYTAALGWTSLWTGTKAGITYGNTTDNPLHVFRGGFGVNTTYTDPAVAARFQVAGQNEGAEFIRQGAAIMRVVSYNRTASVFGTLMLDGAAVQIAVSGTECFTIDSLTTTGAVGSGGVAYNRALPSGAAPSMTAYIPVMIAGVRKYIPLCG